MTPHPFSRRAVAGFSLIELMVAITVGLLVVAAVGLIFVASRQTQRTGEGMARVQETARTASLILDASVRLAGYLPDPRTQVDPTTIFVPPRRAISGGLAAVPPYAGIANALASSDYLAVSFVGNDDGTLKTCLGDDVNASQRAFMVFYLSQEPGDDTPSLSCATEITGLGVVSAVTLNRHEPIQQGVANMTVLFGIDTNGDLQTDRYVSAIGVTAVDTGETIPANNWNHITSVEITLTAQSEAIERGQANAVHLIGGRLDRPIRQTIALRNRLIP